MLNWLSRYAAVSPELQLDDDGALRESVLDVGCGPHGLSVIAPNATFVGIDVAFPATVVPGMVAFRSRPGPLPFVDGSFDAVVCLDVLEHVPPDERAAFVSELARVAARRVLVACPTDEGRWVESVLRNAYMSTGAPLPEWLGEHDEYGLPAVGDVAGWCESVPGFRAVDLPMPNGLLSGLTVIADMLPELSTGAAAEWEQNRTEWVELLQNARFGRCYRKGYLLERVMPATAVVDAADVAGSVWSALPCPACGASATLTVDGTARCGACGHAVHRTDSAAWDIAPPVVVPSRSPSHPAGPPLLLAPASWKSPLEWLPVLTSYLAAVPADSDVVLYVDTRAPDVDAEVLRGILAGVCDYVSEGEPFADVALLDATVDVPTGARRITAPDELSEILGIRLPDPPRHADEVVAHARWAKAMVDAIQADLDRSALAAAPSPRPTAGSLVTVRIPTYGSTEALIERTIPSVLAGAWPNVEVLVCSDGPQPEARSAVGAIGDPRVRYLELDERPGYPSHPESFWQTAGTYAVNHLLDEARGDFIAPLDHDDAFTFDHIPRLLDFMQRSGSDFVYGQAMTEYPNRDWRLLGSAPLAHGQIVHATVLYSARLAHMRYDPFAWLLDEPGDWNLWRRIRDTGAAVAHLPEPVALHFRERSSIGGQQRSLDAVTESMAADVLSTPARELLRICSRRSGVHLAQAA
jgi:SAM-dependent methyltransferase